MKNSKYLSLYIGLFILLFAIFVFYISYFVIKRSFESNLQSDAIILTYFGKYLNISLPIVFISTLMVSILLKRRLLKKGYMILQSVIYSIILTVVYILIMIFVTSLLN